MLNRFQSCAWSECKVRGLRSPAGSHRHIRLMKNNSLILWLLQLMLSVAPAFGGYKDDIGLVALQLELGAGTPTGAGVTFSQVEAPEASSFYAPNSSDPEFTGKSFTLKSGTSGVSGHATGVAHNAYGLTIGVAPGITDIAVYEGGNFVGAGFLRAGSLLLAPAVETNRIQNHSWIGSSASAQDVIRRLDFAIKRDGFVGVLGLDNGSATVVPDFLANSYNGISVGQPSGDHSQGGTRFDTAGRLKPDIVAPSAYGAVSFSVGVVSGAAALLLETADKSAGLANARANSEVIKSLLMAGATKVQFPTWGRTSTRPLDPVYGAGQLNIQNSYHILTAGEQAASTSSTVSPQGWDFATSGTAAARYFFDVPAGYALTNFSAMLVWNRNVYDSNAGPVFNLEATLANLDLRLYGATDFTVGSVLDSSVGTNDNVEHIFQLQLPTGRYALDVTWDLTGHDYAIAWSGTLVSSASLFPVTLVEPIRTATDFRFSFATQTGQSYVVQSSSSLSSPGWTDVTTVPGTGSMVTVTNAIEPTTQYFYRVITQ